jgi:hypothetical protein
LTFPALDDIMKLTHANDATGGRLQIGIPGRLRIGMHGRLRRNPQKMTSFARKEVATGKTAATYGEHPTGYAYYTKGGHFLIFAVAQDRKKNEKIAAPTDAERIELFKSMFAWGGIYKIEGNKIIFDVDIAWVQSWVGTTRTYQVEMASNKLTVTTPPFKSTLDGQDIVVVTTYERAE